MKTLIKLAMEAREKSYCPYSGFAVGAALQTKEGKIYQGCNIENAAFTPTNVGGKKDGVLELTSPCGVCLQVMQEFCDPDAFEVILAAAEEKYEILKLRQLLPYGFEL